MFQINVREYRRAIQNSEKLAAQGKQYDDKQNNNTTQSVPETTTHKQAQTRHEGNNWG